MSAFRMHLDTMAVSQRFETVSRLSVSKLGLIARLHLNCTSKKSSKILAGTGSVIFINVLHMHILVSLIVGHKSTTTSTERKQLYWVQSTLLI